MRERVLFFIHAVNKLQKKKKKTGLFEFAFKRIFLNPLRSVN